MAMPEAAMAGAGGGLIVVGVSHRNSPLDWRERFALVEAELPALLVELRRRGRSEAVLLATCDRVELTLPAAGSHGTAALFAELVAPAMGLAPAPVEAAAYLHSGTAALRHLCAVAAALDSMVIGEPQVLGQLREAHRRAAAAGMVGGALEPAFLTAFAAARRVRRETRIAERPVSMAAAAIELAREIHGDLERCAALLIGPSEMGELMGEQLHRAGLGRLVVCGPPSRAERAARRFACNFLPLEALDNGLGEADIVVASLGNGRRSVTAAAIASALRRRRHRPVFVIDAAIPADVEPGVNDLDGAFLYDLDDLERAAMAGRATREAAAIEAWAIIEAELAARERRLAERALAPAVVALRRHFESVRAEVLAQSSGLDAAAATRLLVNRLLHGPSAVLRADAATADAAALETLLRRLFRLGVEAGAGEETEDEGEWEA